jgi:hypothetical protein
MLQRVSCTPVDKRGTAPDLTGIAQDAPISPFLTRVIEGMNSQGLSKMQTSLHEIDLLKTQIYEDFLQSIASVRAGKGSEIAFLEHERRVRELRQRVAAAEAPPVRLRLVN